jgi:glucose/arabinose dehydrogenase
LLANLPCAGHQTNALAFGPDGLLYISQGEFNNQPGALLRFNVDRPDAKPEEFATGLRNPYDFLFAPNGDILSTDNGPDDHDGPEELNHIVQGGDYGFPRFFGAPPSDSHTIAPIATFTQHAAAEGIAMYTGPQFPAEYQGDLFIALFGQLFTNTIVGHKVVRVKLMRDGNTYRANVSDFVTGLDRPLDVAVGPDGALYINEFVTGVIYRVTYQH